MIRSLSSNAYISDILHQPDSLRDTVHGLAELRFDEIEQFAKRIADHSIKRVVLTGMGSSYHSLHPIFLTLTDSGIQVQMIETSELIHFAPKLLSPETLVIAVSQSGYSAEILQLLKLLGKQIPLIGITNTLESPLAQHSKASLITQAGSEYSVSCKTYVSTLAALAVVGDLLTGREPKKTFSALGETTDAVAQYLSAWKQHVEFAMQIVDGINYLIIAGRGASLAAAGAGGLIIKEAAHFPAEGMSCAAFRHGPLEMVSGKMLLLVYEGTGFARELNAKLVQDVKKVGGRSELIARNKEQHIFKLPIVPDACLSIMEILPLQLTSIALAIQNNHEPGQFERATKTTIIE